MKVTNMEVWNSTDPLRKLIEIKLPMEASYGIAILANKLQEKVKVINDTRDSLIRTYGKEDPKQKGSFRLEPTDNNFPKFADDLAELLTKEVEVVCDKVKLPKKVTGSCDKCGADMDKPLEIEPSILMALVKFVEIG